MNPIVKKFEVPESEPVKGYKAVLIGGKELYTDGLGKGEKVVWERDKVYSLEATPSLCDSGFHFCRHLPFVVNFFDEDHKYGVDYEIWECEGWGLVEEDTYKITSQHIKLTRRVSKKEMKKSLDKNNNIGERNSGNRNSGDWNSGHRNSGDKNSGCFSSSPKGYQNWFCTETKYFLFDIEVKEIPAVIQKLNMSWFSVLGKSYHEAWKACPDEIMEIFRSIPEFQTKEAKKKFKEITGREL